MMQLNYKIIIKSNLMLASLSNSYHSYKYSLQIKFWFRQIFSFLWHWKKSSIWETFDHPLSFHQNHWCCNRRAWGIYTTFQRTKSGLRDKCDCSDNRRYWCCMCWNRLGNDQLQPSCRTSCDCWTKAFECRFDERRSCRLIRFSLLSNQTSSSDRQW